MSAQGEPFGRTGKGLESILQQHLKLVLLLVVGSAAAADSTDSTAGHLSSSSVELLLSKEPPNNLFTNPQVSCFILPSCLPKASEIPSFGPLFKLLLSIKACFLLGDVSIVFLVLLQHHQDFNPAD